MALLYMWDVQRALRISLPLQIDKKIKCWAEVTHVRTELLWNPALSQSLLLALLDLNLSLLPVGINKQQHSQFFYSLETIKKKNIVERVWNSIVTIFLISSSFVAVSRPDEI